MSRNEQGTGQFSTSQARPLQPDERGAHSPKLTGNYSDIEQFSRQAGAGNQTQQAPLPADPPSEFQRFVASTTGQMIPIFGASLFKSVPSTFAPLDMTPVPPDYIIGPGDELRIRIWGQVAFQTNLRVDRSGEIFLPEVGPIHVAGMPFSALDGHLRNAVARVYHNFDLTADVGQIRAIQVYVSGQARRPGVYTVSSLSSLVDALFASGGPTTQGSLRHIQLRRDGKEVTDFDLYDLLIRGDKSKDVKVQSGDVIFIPPVGPQVAVTGSVRNPAIYELQPNESLATFIADAGGVSSVAANSRVSIERIDDHRDRHAMEVEYDTGGLATPLADGDIVRIYSIVPVYRKTVMIRGNTSNPGRFAWRPGMRISDLIPDKESLITRNYWWKRAQRGLPVPEEADAPNQSGLPQQAEIRAQVPEIDWDYAVIERLDTETLKTNLVPFDLGKLVMQHDASQNLELQPGDVVAIFSQAEIRVPIAQQTKSVGLGGEFFHAGLYTARPGETLRQLVERAGGLTPNAYLYASEFTRESTRAMQQTRIDQYLQKLSAQTQRSNLAMASSPVSSTQDLASGVAAQSSERDLLASLQQIHATGRIVLRLTPESNGTMSVPDIALEDGDRFVVPPVPSTVNVLGAVYNQNSFQYATRSRVGTYLQMAGGPNRDADKKHAYLIRASGEVISREETNGLWGNEFTSLRVNPGDTILVPEKTFKLSALRGVLDWSQMFSQFAVGAAAINVIK